MAKTDTIAAIATPLGKAGIGIIRLSGPDAISIADKIFSALTHRTCKRYISPAAAAA